MIDTELGESIMARQSRREFLENSMFAAAAAVAAGSVGEVRAADQGSKSPNEKLRVAVMGVRGRGNNHLQAFSGRNDTEVAIVCDVDTKEGGKRVDELKKKGQSPRLETDIRKVLEDKSIDIVSIATPNHWHALAAIWAIQAGKDVYLEKPVSHNVSEGRRIVEAARKYKKIVQTGTQCRTTSATRDAVEYVQSGKIGDCRLARGLCYKRRKSIGEAGNYEPPSTVDYGLWSGPVPIKPVTRPQFHYDWHWQFDYGNGDLGNQGIHQMDIARWGLGEDNLGTKVCSYGGRVGYEDAGNTANTQVSIHDYADGKRLVFEVRGLDTKALRGAKVGVIFYGTDGYVVMHSYTGGGAFDADGKMIKKFTGGGDHFANFLKAVRSRDHQDLNADIEEGHQSSALCHLGNISYLLGEELPAIEVQERLQGDAEAQATFKRFANHLEDNGLPPESTLIHFGKQLQIDGEEFAGSDVEKANQMLTREYREGFEVPSSEATL